MPQQGMQLIPYTGWYPYIQDLLDLQAATLPRPPYSTQLLQELLIVSSPLHQHIDAWTAAMATHSVPEFAQFILSGIEGGFRIGYCRRQLLVPASHNLPSARDHAEVVEQYLTDEISAGRIIGPFSLDEVPGIQINWMGVIGV